MQINVFNVRYTKTIFFAQVKLVGLHLYCIALLTFACALLFSVLFKLSFLNPVTFDIT